MEKIKIILVDDDLLLGSVMVQALQDNGYDVHYQNTLAGVEQAIIKTNPGLIILDVMVGDENSLEEINNIKLAAVDCPIIFISSYKDIEYQQLATTNGAVMYLEKPFTYDKLLLWVKRFAKGSNNNQIHLVNIGDYVLNTLDQSLQYKNKEVIPLRNTEYETLRLLVLNKNMLVTRGFLKNTVWQGVICSDESLNNIVCRLRKYLSKDSRLNIKTQRGMGFLFTNQDEE